MQADALATVLIAMSPDDAIALANRRGLRALLIGRDGAGYVARHTGTWASQ
jgi:thiamine biosynthesis lipoprotein ApbE